MPVLRKAIIEQIVRHSLAELPNLACGFERLERESVLPTTSQPSAGAFREVYQRLADEATICVSEDRRLH